MLELRKISAGYESGTIIHNISLSVDAGQNVGLIGRNGAGKTTLIKSIMGLTNISAGQTLFDSHELQNMPAHKIPSIGIAVVPQGKRAFPDLEVGENLYISTARIGTNSKIQSDVAARFPQIFAKLTQKAGTLSGGEQQMLAIARALLQSPSIILLDEPTEGLMPKLVNSVHNEIISMRDSGIGVLLAEQNLTTALELCDHIYALENGEIVWDGPVDENTRQHIEPVIGIGGMA